LTERAHSGTFEHEAPVPDPSARGLEVFIGKRINEGATIATPAAPSSRILTTDVYG
jgi:hypothetical protein